MRRCRVVRCCVAEFGGLLDGVVVCEARCVTTILSLDLWRFLCLVSVWVDICVGLHEFRWLRVLGVGWIWSCWQLDVWLLCVASVFLCFGPDFR